MTNPVSYLNVDITDGFWAEKQKMNREVSVYAVRDRFEDTGRMKAFEFGWKEGSDEPQPHFFWDSDVAKWMESVCYIYAKNPDDELMDEVNELLGLMEKNQADDGYFNIYHQIVEPELKFKNRDHHELYCLGHFIEAAVAYKQATGSDRFINFVDRYIDLVIKVFTVEHSAEFTTPGHEEIELALFKLYNITGVEKYYNLAMFFVNERGKKEEYTPEWCNPNYNQSHMPLREQRDAQGHSVRAGYIYCAMADAARYADDDELLTAAKAIFDDITLRKMYITGGVGSAPEGEAFTVDYDLPNDTAYTETCASIALAFFADRLKDIELDSKYADIYEREIYNGILSGISLDGKAFFYENPLEINLADRSCNLSVKQQRRLPITRRQEVFGCSCCPPNETRFISAIGGSIYSSAENEIYIHQFMSSSAVIDGAEVSIETVYPAGGKVTVGVSGAKGRRLFVRIPGWCEKYSFSKEYRTSNGYAVIDVDSDSFTLNIDFEMKPRFVYANPLVRADAGKAALMYGPVVYCMEENDNAFKHFTCAVDGTSEPVIEFSDYFGANTITFDGYIPEYEKITSLYSLRKPVKDVKTKVKFIPYFAFANREECDMAVWFAVK